MKIAILGTQGMAGHVVLRYLKNRFKDATITSIAKNNADINLDVLNTWQVFSVISNLINNNYDFIINCIGFLNKPSIEEPDKAIIINSWFPKILEKLTKNTNTVIIHISTDCVFDGIDGPYVETSNTTEVNAYGRSKALGEINNSKDITLRTSIIGPELKVSGIGLLHWFLINKDKEVNGWSNAWWNGITTLQLAKSIADYLELDNKPTGLYHLVSNRSNDVSNSNSHIINKYELLKLFNIVFNKNKIVNKTVNNTTINKVLINTREEFSNISTYLEQLEELKGFMSSGSYIY